MKILNSKEKKILFNKLKEKYGFLEPKEKLNYVFLINNKNKIYLLNRSAAEFFHNELSFDATGLYFGQLMPGNDIRLSIEGSQLVGPFASKNIIELDDENFNLWIHGSSIDINIDEKSFVIIKHKNHISGFDYFGSGKAIIKKENDIKVLLNYVPKTRYIHS